MEKHIKQKEEITDESKNIINGSKNCKEPAHNLLNIKDKINLNGMWYFTNLPNGEKIMNSFENWNKIIVPSAWEFQGYKVENKSLNELVAFYGTTLNLSKSKLKKQIFIYFGAVKSKFELWINGNCAGSSNDSMLPVDFNITDFCKEGENVITIKVINYANTNHSYTMSGICGDVFVYFEPNQYIWDYYTSVEFEENYSLAKLSINVILRNASSGKKPCTIEIHIKDRTEEKTEIFAEAKLVLNSEEEKSIVLREIFKEPKLWSAESPNLYDISIVLKNYKQEIIQEKCFQYGFREIIIKDTKLIINGKPIILKGVNRQDYNTQTGCYFKREEYEKDLKIVKQNNINSIKISNELCSPTFYELCDLYGIYIIVDIDEVFNKEEQIKRSVLTHVNYACIIVYNINKNLGDLKDIIEVKKIIKAKDNARIVYYEGLDNIIISDVNAEIIDNAYNELENNKDKSVIFSQYAFARENALGNIVFIVDNLRKHSNWVGGYISNFADNTFFAEVEGKKQCLYRDDNSLTGLVDSERELHPSIFEVKKAYQDFTIELVDITKGIFEIINCTSTTNLNTIDLKWSITRDGILVLEEFYEQIDCKPFEKHRINISFENIDMSLEGDYYILFELLMKKDTEWANKGFVLGFEQFKLKKSKKTNNLDVTKKISVRESGRFIEIDNDDMNLMINKTYGAISYLKYNKIEFITDLILPNYMRLLTDNDIYYTSISKDRNRSKSLLTTFKYQNYNEWERNNKIKEISIHEELNLVRIYTKCKNKLFKNNISLYYTISGKGQIIIEHLAIPKNNTTCFGMQCKISNKYNNIIFYGKGPQETYDDRKQGAQIKIYSGKVNDFIHNYVRPQENGNHTDIRWFKLLDDTGNGIKISALNKNYLNISVWPYAMENISEANYRHELLEQDYLTVNINSYLKGVGIFEVNEKNEDNTDKEFYQKFIIEPICSNGIII